MIPHVCPCCGRCYTVPEVRALPSLGIGMGLDHVQCVCGDNFTRPVSAEQSREFLRRVSDQIRKAG